VPAPTPRAGVGRLLLASLPVPLLLTSQAVDAQRSGENVLRSAEDAFGSSLGAESIGLYSPDNVRGFSPFSAGNVRIEGLYLDAVTGFNGRLVRGSTVRVGISAQGYPFPAPTGIADFRLRLPGDEPALSVVASGESYGTVRGEADFQLPLSNRLSIGGGLSASSDKAIWGSSGVHASAALLARWRPIEGAEIIPFWSGLVHRSEDTQPRFVMAGDFLPSKVERGAYLAQPWALFNAEDVNYGTVGRYSSGNFSIAAGIFRSLFQNDGSYSDLFLNTTPDGMAQHVVVAAPDFKRGGTSGEVRASLAFPDGPRRHGLIVNIRARDQDRLYGGSTSVDLGPASIFDPGIAPEPEFVFGARNRDEISQLSAGIGYEGRWAGIGELTLGVQKTRYRKTVDIPGVATPPTEASPWLFNAAAALHLSSRWALYGGFTRGLEESGVAPDTAINRDDAPPALLTRQYDGGLRWAPTQGIRLVAGFFNVEKPYFNLDPARIFRRLGEVRHRGLEISFTGEVTPNLNLVAGAVLLDARVLGEAVEAGLVGNRPVGSTRRTIIFNAEYRPPSVPGLALDLGMNSYGDRVANSLNTLSVPAWNLVNAGLRYQWQLAGRPTTVRLQLVNLLNEYVWELRGSNAFFYNAPRHLAVRITRDF
jgi:iron complex outermembrane recepter protein